jgi:hypothetical protein
MTEFSYAELSFPDAWDDLLAEAALAAVEVYRFDL